MEDPIERAFVELCNRQRLRFSRPEKAGGRLDFHLTDFNLFVEVKAHSCERLLDQLESVSGKPVMVLIGLSSVEAFGNLLLAARDKHLR